MCCTVCGVIVIACDTCVCGCGWGCCCTCVCCCVGVAWVWAGWGVVCAGCAWPCDWVKVDACIGVSTLFPLNALAGITWTFPRPGIFWTGNACMPAMLGIWMMFAFAGRICCNACVGITVNCCPCAFVMVMGWASFALAIVWIVAEFGTDCTNALDTFALAGLDDTDVKFPNFTSPIPVGWTITFCCWDAVAAAWAACSPCKLCNWFIGANCTCCICPLGVIMFATYRNHMS